MCRFDVEFNIIIYIYINVCVCHGKHSNIIASVFLCHDASRQSAVLS